MQAKRRTTAHISGADAYSKVDLLVKPSRERRTAAAKSLSAKLTWLSQYSTQEPFHFGGLKECGTKKLSACGLNGFMLAGSKETSFGSWMLLGEAQSCWQLTTSSGQGASGSFKDRKPIGEVSCCDVWMAGRTHSYGPTGAWSCACWSGCSGHRRHTCWM